MAKGHNSSHYGAENPKSAESDTNDSILAKLTDMFGEVVPSSLISTICVTNNWQIDNCIECLIKHIEDHGCSLDESSDTQQLVETTNDTYQLITPSSGTEISQKFNETERTSQTVMSVNTTFPEELPGIPVQSLTSNQLASSYQNDNADFIIESVEISPNQENYPPPDPPRKHLGAIPKSTKSSTATQSQNSENIDYHYQAEQQPGINFAEIFKKGIKEFVPPTVQSNFQKERKTIPDTAQIVNLMANINSGFKFMILLRGAPGSGKSTLARDIVDRTVGGDYRNHIFSSDDFFYNQLDQYVYQPNKLSEAHEFNQKRVRQRAASGWSPIFVDNTNMKVWEMLPYVDAGVNYGYVLEILEPNTPWSQSAGKLAYKNRHGVTRDRILRILSKYERTSVEDLLLLNKRPYQVSCPQWRHNPPLPFTLIYTNNDFEGKNTFSEQQIQGNISEIKPKENDSIPESKDSLPWEPYNLDTCTATTCNSSPPKDNTPKPPRENLKRERNANLKHLQEDDGPLNLNLSEEISWKSYEEESNEYWQTQQMSENVSVKPTDNKIPKPKRSPKKDDTIIAALKEQSTPTTQEKGSSETSIGEKLERHVVGCASENKTFVMLRQIYPNKQIDGLWDLFEKCKGNIDWAIEILLKDDSCIDQEDAAHESKEFACTCNAQHNVREVIEEDTQRLLQSDPLSSRQKSKRDKGSNELLKSIINKQFVIGDEHYSSHTRKIRDLRRGTDNEQIPMDAQQEEDIVEKEKSSSVEDVKENDDEMSSETDSDEIVEINLGRELVDQLENMFETESSVKQSIDLKTNVFMPKSVAKQLYAIWIESLYNQLEDQRQKCIKEDEEFARYLESQEEKYSKNTNTQKLGMDILTYLYSGKNSWKDSNAEDLASHLTRLKLFEIFPNIDKKVLLDEFAANGSKFSETVEALRNSINSVPNDNLPIGNAEDKEEFDKVPSNNDTVNKKLTPEELKKAAIHDFEESRNLAVHHSQLKAECYLKAKEAIQKGNTAVAVYYSQIADLHKKKIDDYNHKAASCIMTVHDTTQNNPDFIDLHYLHVIEAEQCLDIFIDKHITKLKNYSKCYKYIFIITGRGLHSAGGISTIKNKVKFRLKERNLKWSEVNPGLLKVKIFAASKYSKAI